MKWVLLKPESANFAQNLGLTLTFKLCEPYDTYGPPVDVYIILY